MTKYIFITGGVVSGLGKGITAASLGRLLKLRGLKIASLKLDPYMNVDPGTMSPYQHGEVYVTEDGAETDLDLGHYERFIDENLTKYSNLTSGKVYFNVLNKERLGGYLGETVQVIPHITNEIKDFIYLGAKNSNCDCLLTEIGGTIGDIESQPFLEAIRQISLEVGLQNCLFIHVTLVPYIKGSFEHKSKPTQHSVKELRSIGINPNIIVARADEKIDQSILSKIALFCNVKEDCVIENLTLDNLYECPIMLNNQGLDKVVIRELGLKGYDDIDLSSWLDLVKRIKSRKKAIKIALVGKYVKLHDAYLSIVEALNHAGYYNECSIDLSWIDSETITKENVKEVLGNVQGVIVPGGFGDRGIEGMIIACEYARTNNVPLFGICLGMQIMVIEFARNVLNLQDANSKEFNAESKNLVIDLMESQLDVVKKGGTMRLGGYPCKIDISSKMYECYKTELISERHRHRYEFNNLYREGFISNGGVFGGVSPDNLLVEEFEYPKNDFYLGVQFHPEFKSRPTNAHPLFLNFVESICKRG